MTTPDPGDLLFIAIKRNHLKQLEERLHRGEFRPKGNTHAPDIITEITRMAQVIGHLDPDGLMITKNRYGDHTTGTYIDLAILIAEIIGADLNDPSCKGLKCTCPTRCDCQDYDNGLVSNECPIHNTEPQPSLDCPQHGHPLHAD